MQNKEFLSVLYLVNNNEFIDHTVLSKQCTAIGPKKLWSLKNWGTKKLSKKISQEKSYPKTFGPTKFGQKKNLVGKKSC